MDCTIVRPFDLVTRFWTYKITVNEQDFIFKGKGNLQIDVKPAHSYEIRVSTPGQLYRFSSPVYCCELHDGSQIVIRSKYTNWWFFIAFLFPILLMILGWIILKSTLFMVIMMSISILFHTYFVDMKRKKFFEITTCE